MSKRAMAFAAGIGCLALGIIGAGAVGIGLIVSNAPQLAGPESVEYAVPSASEVETFGRMYEQTVLTNADLTIAHFDARAIAVRAMPDDLTPIMRRQIAQGFETGFERDGLVPTLAQEVAAGGSYSFRQVTERDGRPVARFRLLPTTGGVSFHDYVVGKRPTGELLAIDVHILNTGEYLSESVGSLLGSFVSEDPSLLERMRGERNELADDLPKFEEMSGLLTSGDAEGALAVYDSMSESSQGQRMIMLLRVQAGALLDDDARYLSMLDELAAAFPDDPAANTYLLDAYFLRQSWSKSLEALEVLSGEYPDPYWDAIRARVFLGASDLEAASAAAHRVVLAEPALIDGHDVLLVVSLATGDDERADTALRDLITQFDVDPTLLLDEPGYERVRELPAYLEYTRVL